MRLVYGEWYFFWPNIDRDQFIKIPAALVSQCLKRTTKNLRESRPFHLLSSITTGVAGNSLRRIRSRHCFRIDLLDKVSILRDNPERREEQDTYCFLVMKVLIDGGGGSRCDIA